MRRLVGLLAATAALAGCDGFAPPKVDYRPGEAGTIDHAMCLLGFSGVPMRRLSTGHQVVALTLNGRPATFVVDTGANMTVIHDDFAERFDLTADAGLRAPAIANGGALRARQAGLESMSIGGIPIRRGRIVVAGLGQVTETLAPFAGTEIHGILGQDVLGEHRAVIDVARPILYLIAADEDPAPVPSERCVPAAEGDGGNASGSASK